MLFTSNCMLANIIAKWDGRAPVVHPTNKYILEAKPCDVPMTCRVAECYAMLRHGPMGQGLALLTLVNNTRKGHDNMTGSPSTAEYSIIS